MIFRCATPADVPLLIQLQNESHISHLGPQQLQDGFLSKVLNEQQLLDAIKHEQAVYVAEFNKQVIAMAVCASWRYWQFSPSVTQALQSLGDIVVAGEALNQHNSLFWGPVCVRQSERRQGVFASLFEYARLQSLGKNRHLYTYIPTKNRRALSAHVNKVLFIVKGEWAINQQHVTHLVCTTP